MDSLCRLINIKPDKSEMICMVGAGGKTSAMFLLARELSDKGKKVLVTTTTAIYHPEKEQYDDILISEGETMDLFDNRSGSITVLGRSVSSEGKLLGVSPEVLDSIFLKGTFDYIIVEGDGSKSRPVKAPAGHEPVIPSQTTRLLGLIGLDSIGKEVGMEFVHRPELFCRISGCVMGDIINTEMISRLIIHEEGLFKAAPDLSERYLLLNKAEGEREKREAYNIVKKLLDSNYKLNGIVISSMKNRSFVNALKRVSGIILASGLSRRMGTNKLLLPVGGIPAIERVIAAASKSALFEVILVCSNAEIASIGNKYGKKIVDNIVPELGQSRSVALGVENSSPEADGFMFLVGDQPFITENIINSLLQSYITEDCSAVIPLYNGNRGNPVIFTASLREKLMSLTGDTGGRVLLSGLEESTVTVNFTDEKPGYDFDTREEYEAVLLQEDKNV
ncbi:MAG TPA: selenium cofactor biosynthesis protein YqeC [Clostridia bacterium]|nr:selenium cofactor biosynthesis protein YqeC [Clostridia bacterium]